MYIMRDQMGTPHQHANRGLSDQLKQRFDKKRDGTRPNAVVQSAVSHHRGAQIAGCIMHNIHARCNVQYVYWLDKVTNP
jgi:hypothetical protein